MYNVKLVRKCLYCLVYVSHHLLNVVPTHKIIMRKLTNISRQVGT